MQTLYYTLVRAFDKKHYFAIIIIQDYAIILESCKEPMRGPNSSKSDNFLIEDTIKSEEDTKKPTPIASMTLECPSSTNLLHPPSPSSSEISLPSSNSDTPTESTQDPESAPNQSSGSPGIPNVTSAPVKFERTMSTGPDALKKTVKDLHRSSVSLPRFQLLLEEVKIILTKNALFTF